MTADESMRHVASFLLVLFLLVSAMLLVITDRGVAGPYPGGERIDATIRYVLHGSASIPFYTAAERSHLEDVHHLFRGLQVSFVILGTLLAVALIHCHYHARRPHRQLATIVRNAGLALILVALVALLAFLNFDAFWHAIHPLLFPGGNWAFPASSTLIMLFPLTFWMHFVAHILGAALGLGLVCLFGGIIVEGMKPKRVKR